jgi:hypothetical protein
MDEPRELQRWTGYVDAIEGDRVHLVLRDDTVDQGDAKEIGDFPRRLFEDAEPVLPGLFVTVRALSNDTIEIRPVVRTEEDIARGREEAERLLELLEMLRGDHDGGEADDGGENGHDRTHGREGHGADAPEDAGL